jgi:hypothetical protein
MDTTMRRWWNVRSLVTAAMLTASLAAGCQCPRSKTVVGARPDAVEPGRPQPGAETRVDCQQDSILIYVRLDTLNNIDTVTASDLPLIQRIANLPEFHDCQRFVVPSQAAGANQSGLAFGPLVAIWAADSLASRFGVRSEPIAGGQGWSAAEPVALIYNWEGGGAYDPLGINPGFSCLYLSHDGSRPRNWKAALVSLGGKHAPCDRALPPEAVGGQTLQVRPMPPQQGVLPDSIPPVARWDWDFERHQQYIGIRCGGQWCEIGRESFVSSLGAGSFGMTPAAMSAMAEPIPGIAPEDSPRGTKEEDIRVVSVKGWYDQQQLDLRDANGKPLLTNIVGTVFPHPALGRAPFRMGEWTPVAYAYVTDDYAGKVPLRKGWNRIYLCNDLAGECRADAPASCPTDPGPPAVKWWTRIVSDGAPAKDYCIHRRTHGGMAIPAAAARWNWNEMDVKTWTQCGAACCTVN